MQVHIRRVEWKTVVTTFLCYTSLHQIDQCSAKIIHTVQLYYPTCTILQQDCLQCYRIDEFTALQNLIKILN